MAKTVETIEDEDTNKTQKEFVIHGVTFQESTSGNFNKKNEFVVLKGTLFKIQTVSPKKLILKYHGIANSEMPDGIFKIIKVKEIKK